MKLLLVEDDLRLMRALERDLKELGYQVDIAWDGSTGLDHALHQVYDLIMLDVMLPGLDGWEVLRKIREKRTTPVLMLTARDAVEDRVAGLEGGADDYLTKPFHFDELVARIRALIRRDNGNKSSKIERGGVLLDPRDKTVELYGERVDLTEREYLILYRLMARRGKIYSNDSLAVYLSTYDDEGVASNTIEVHIYRLRKKLGKESIRTIRGLGYTMPD